jgi:hypothetical protein
MGYLEVLQKGKRDLVDSVEHNYSDRYDYREPVKRCSARGAVQSDVMLGGSHLHKMGNWLRLVSGNRSILGS